MRVIAGRYRGRLIDYPKHIRPTQDKVRQSIFDVLAGVVKGSRVLDLFAGSGAFGLEALSRGAACAYFIDMDKRCSRIIESNLEKLGVLKEEGVCVRNFTNDAFRAIKILEKKKEVFDIVYLDPPYHKELAKKALKTLMRSGILALRSFLVIEHARSDGLDFEPERSAFKLYKEADYGDTRVSFFYKK